ncbi:hypothetical protein [Leucobacter triazinivorans]|uniref:Uncharacterized protein n=1 Tax=Leucobacter triazinivorans TaxID=1784719 RepID=A0A4P6KH86_9MICO|nr:hypothetical protein [Leucobacter triazinivorans]QBE49613.1 hypothetical protein EVS81_12915 [Leucobacter triazinivorans]
MTGVTVQQLVDQVLDTAQAAHPGVEFGITLSLANALLLQKDSDKLWRKDADGREGYYSGHVYRDCLVDEIPSEEPAPIAISLSSCRPCTAPARRPSRR